MMRAFDRTFSAVAQLGGRPPDIVDMTVGRKIVPRHIGTERSRPEF